MRKLSNTDISDVLVKTVVVEPDGGWAVRVVGKDKRAPERFNKLRRNGSDIVPVKRADHTSTISGPG